MFCGNNAPWSLHTHTAPYTPEGASWTRHTKCFALHTEHCTPKNAPWTQHMAHCTPHTEPCTPTCLFTRLEGLAWSHQDFWQPSFCRNCYLGSLFLLGKNSFFLLFPGWKGICKEAWNNMKYTCVHFSCSPCNQCKETLPNFSHHNKSFINYVFCRNWPGK